MASPHKNFLEQHARLLALGSAVFFLAQPSLKPAADVDEYGEEENFGGETDTGGDAEWAVEEGGDVIEDDGEIAEDDGTVWDEDADGDHGEDLDEEGPLAAAVPEGLNFKKASSEATNVARDAAAKKLKDAGKDTAADVFNKTKNLDFSGAFGALTSGAKKAALDSAQAAKDAAAKSTSTVAKSALGVKAPEADGEAGENPIEAHPDGEEGAWDEGSTPEEGDESGAAEGAEGSEAAGGEGDEGAGEHEQAPAEEPLSPAKVKKDLGLASASISERSSRDAGLQQLAEIVAGEYWAEADYQKKELATALYTVIASARTSILGGVTGTFSAVTSSAAQMGQLVDAVHGVLSKPLLVIFFDANQLDLLYRTLTDASIKASRDIDVPAIDGYAEATGEAQKSLALQTLCAAKAQLASKATYPTGLEKLTGFATWFATAPGKAAMATLPAEFLSLFDGATQKAKTQLAWATGSASWSGKDLYEALAGFFKAVRTNAALLAKLSPQTQDLVKKFYVEASKKAGLTIAITAEERAAIPLADRLTEIKQRMTTKAQYASAMDELVVIVGEYGAKVKVGDATAKTACAQISTLMSEAAKRVNLSTSAAGALSFTTWTDKTLVTACQTMLKAAVDNKDFFGALPVGAQKGIASILSKASIKAGAVSEVTGFNAATIDQDLSDIAAGIKASEASYVTALTNLARIIPNTPGDKAKVIFDLLGASRGKVAIRGVMSPLAYRNPATLTAYLNALQAFRSSGLFRASNSKSQSLINTTIIDVKAKLKGDVSDNSAFVQKSDGGAKTVADFDGLVETTNRMLDNKTQYLAALENIKLLTNPATQFAQKPTATQSNKVGALLAKAKKKLAWTSSNFADWSDKGFYTALSDACDAALKNWQTVFGLNLSAAQLTFLSQASRDAKVRSGAAVTAVTSVSVTGEGGALAGEGALLQQLSALQAGIKAAKTGAAYAAAVDPVLDFIRLVGKTTLPASVKTMLYDTIKMAKAKLAWTTGSWDIKSAQGYQAFEKLVINSMPSYAKDMVKAKELNGWLTNAETLRAKASDAAAFPRPARQGVNATDLASGKGTATVSDTFINEATYLSQSLAGAPKTQAEFEGAVDEMSTLVTKRFADATKVTAEEQNALWGAVQGLVSRIKTPLMGGTAFKVTSPYEQFVALCEQLKKFYAGSVNLSKVGMYQGAATKTIASLKAKATKAAAPAPKSKMFNFGTKKAAPQSVKAGSQEVSAS